jgi:transitional endoplasmic reticulum ATPase
VQFQQRRVMLQKAERVSLKADNDLDYLHLSVRKGQFGSLWKGDVLSEGDRKDIPSLDRYPLLAKIAQTQPSGAVSVSRATEFAVIAPESENNPLLPLGGMRDLYMTCRMLAGARFKKGGQRKCAGSVLLSGPAGCGKASLVKRLAQDIGAKLHIFEAHQLLDQLMSGGHADVSLSLSDLARGGSLIILFDHVEVLSGSTLPQEAHKVLAQITSILGEVALYPDVLVFTVCAGMPDPRLMAGRLFDSHFNVDLPNRWGRHEVLLLAMRDKRADADVDLAALAELANGLSARELVGIVEEASLLAGEEPLTQRALMAALRSLTMSLPDVVRSDIPAVFWDDIVGVDDAKQQLHETLLLALSQHERFTVAGIRPPCSILLSGGQGTGKSSLVRALASYVPLNLVEVNCRQLVVREEDGSAKQYVNDIFALARRKAPCIVFLDDIEALFDGEMKPEGAYQNQPLVELLMMEVDSVAALSGIVVVAATSRPDRLTNDVLRVGRFDFSLMLSLPEARARREILQGAVKKMPMAADIDFDRLASMTHGFSPADLANLCNRVGLLAFSRSYSNGGCGVIPPVIDAELFEQALRGRKSS